MRRVRPWGCDISFDIKNPPNDAAQWPSPQPLTSMQTPSVRVFSNMCTWTLDLAFFQTLAVTVDTTMWYLWTEIEQWCDHTERRIVEWIKTWRAFLFHRFSNWRTFCPIISKHEELIFSDGHPRGSRMTNIHFWDKEELDTLCKHRV